MIRRGLALLVAGCNGAGAPAGEPLARVGDEVVDASVVRMVAERDGVDEAEARERVADTLRAVAAARRAAAQEPEPAPLVEPTREEHLLRAARARVWLHDDFEPEHGVDAIPDDDPLLAQTKASAKFVHPRLHLLCQLVAVPSEGTTLAEMIDIASDPAWMEKARARFEPAAERLQRYVRPEDPDACGLMPKLLRFDQREGDGVTLRIEAQAFDLDACEERADDGSCKTPSFLPDWTERVRAAEPPGFIPPFSTRYGWHLVFVQEVLPERSLDDPETIAWLRREVHPRWQHQAFQQYIDRLRERRAVRIADPEPTP